MEINRLRKFHVFGSSLYLGMFQCKQSKHRCRIIEFRNRFLDLILNLILDSRIYFKKKGILHHSRQFYLCYNAQNTVRILFSFLDVILFVTDVDELRQMVEKLDHRIQVLNATLVRQLRVRDRRLARRTRQSDLLTATLQAVSGKRRTGSLILLN